MTDLCGHETASGDPCQLTASQSDGLCHHHTDSDAVADGGRPSKFDSCKDAILDAAQRGTTKEGCARAAGIAYETLRRWLEEKDEFSAAFKRARAKGEQELIEAVAEDDPRFVLERSYEYIKTEKVEQETTHKGDGFNVNINHHRREDMDDE